MGLTGNSVDTIIMGAGLSGLSAAYHLESNYKIVESNYRVGGLCKSDFIDGFTFDYTGHLLHIKSKYTERLIKKLLGNNIRKIKRNSWIYSSGTFTPYPYQSNLFGLPTNIVKECLIGFIKSMYERKDMDVKTFEDWTIKYLGEGISNRFMIPYNKKLWTIHPREMTTEWMGDYVPNPTLDEIIDGALRIPEKNWGYNAYFYYPKFGGIHSLVKGFLKHIDEDAIYCNKRVIGIDLMSKMIFYDDGTDDAYKNIISTIPLNELMGIIEGMPKIIKEQASKLRFNSVLNINFGINSDVASDKHWIYFPEEDYIFYRIGFPSNFSGTMAPEGCSSIYTEISYSNEMPLEYGTLKDIEKRVYNDLLKCKILKADDKIVSSHTTTIKPAYVIYDKNWKSVRDYLLNYLKGKGLMSIGRYGAWEYSAMEDAILQGKSASEIINNKK